MKRPSTRTRLAPPVIREHPTGFSVKVWNAETGEELCELGNLPGGSSLLTDLCFSPDGRRLATAWSDGVIRLHDCDRQPGRTPQRVLCWPAGSDADRLPA